MSIYSFTCKRCQSEWDAIVGPINDPDSKRCPECGSTKIHRNWNCSLADGVYTKPMTEEDKKNGLSVKKYYEQPDVQAKIRSGEIRIKETGPSEFHPTMDKRFY